jgi:Holliday junction resolvasome RuvABC DNA-binding subunit
VRHAGKAQGPREEAAAALVARGYKPPEVAKMVDAVNGGDGLASEEWIRRALQATARRRG